MTTGQQELIFGKGAGSSRPSGDASPAPEEAATEDWTPVQLRDVGQWLSGGTPFKANPRFWAGDIPWVSPKDMKQVLIGDAQDHISELGAAAGSRMVPADTLLMVVRGMILAHTFPVCRTTRAVAFNQDVKALIPRAGISPEFLTHWFVGHAYDMLGLVTEATHGTKRIDLKDLHGYEMRLPPEPEQRAIAHVLTSLDALIEDTEAGIAKLEAVRAGMLHDMLTRGVDEK